METKVKVGDKIIIVNRNNGYMAPWAKLYLGTTQIVKYISSDSIECVEMKGLIAKSHFILDTKAARILYGK